MYAIEALDLRKSYGSKQALDGLTLQVPEGKIFGIVGPNGSGKTTFIEMAEGLRTPDSGTVKVLGLDPIQESHKVKNLIGVQLQSTSLHPFATPREIMDLFASFYEKTVDIEALFRFFHLDKVMNTQIRNLSGGWRQRVVLGVALLNDPKVVFLDEPTTGLDPQSRLELWQYIKELKKEGRTIVLCTHYLDEAEKLCDQIAVINNGRVMKVETPDKLAKNDRNLVKIQFYGVSVNEDVALKQLKHVLSVERMENGQIVLSSMDSDETLWELLQLAQQKGWKLERIRIEEPSLDDVFMEIASGGASS